MKKLKIAVSLFFVVVFCFCAACSPNKQNEQTDFNIHTEYQQNYLNDTYDSIDKYFGYQSGDESFPLAVNLSLKNKSGKNAKNIVVKTADGNIFYQGVFNGEESLQLQNLYVNTQYEWYFTDGSDVAVSESYRFNVTCGAPRNIYLEGVTNCRDLGGWGTSNGKHVKQGMIYRSGRFNKNKSQEITITQNGISAAISQLNVKTEVDLRSVADNENGGLTVSPLGESVQYISLPMEYDNMLGDEKNLEMLREMFSVFANQSNYPIIFHCSIGTDRTGMVAFMLNAFLGVAKEDLYRDYLFSNFGKISGSRDCSAIDKYIKVLQNAGGESLSKQAENYLLSIGVSINELNTIKQLMVE